MKAFSKRELTFILNTPTQLFGKAPVQRRNKAMCAIIYAAKPSIEELRRFNVDDFDGYKIFMRRRADGFNEITLSEQCRDILNDCIAYLYKDFPESTVLCHHPLLFNPNLPSHPMTERDIESVIVSCSPLTLKRRTGEKHAITA